MSAKVFRSEYDGSSGWNDAHRSRESSNRRSSGESLITEAANIARSHTPFGRLGKLEFRARINLENRLAAPEPPTS
jgi:hypothetical protein